MEPSLTPEDERLLVAIRSVIRERGEGTWEDTTATYNWLDPSRVEQRLPSLIPQHETIKQRVERISERIEYTKLRAGVERLPAKADSRRGQYLPDVEPSRQVDQHIAHELAVIVCGLDGAACRRFLLRVGTDR
jgi:hypothetical protein